MLSMQTQCVITMFGHSIAYSPALRCKCVRAYIYIDICLAAEYMAIVCVVFIAVHTPVLFP